MGLAISTEDRPLMHQMVKAEMGVCAAVGVVSLLMHRKGAVIGVALGVLAGLGVFVGSFTKEGTHQRLWLAKHVKEVKEEPLRRIGETCLELVALSLLSYGTFRYCRWASPAVAGLLAGLSTAMVVNRGVALWSLSKVESPSRG